MSDAREPDEGGDLLGRWLAHREETEEDAPRPRTYGVPRTSRATGPDAEHPGAPDGSTQAQDLPAGAGTDPEPPRLEAPAHRAPTPAPSAPPREPVGLEDFEPVVIASVRRAAEAPAEPTRSRLRGGRRRAEPGPAGTDPHEPEAVDADVEPDTGSAPDPLPAPDVEHDPAGDPAPSDAVDPEPAAEQQPAPTPEPSVAEQVVAEVSSPTEDPAASVPPAPPRRRRERRSARRAPDWSAYAVRARSALDRSVRGTPEERATPTAPAAPPTTATPVTPVTAGTPGTARSAYDELRAQREAAAPPLPDTLPPDVDFRPRTGARTVTSLLLLVGLVATGVAAWRAYDSRVETDIGLAAILALATGVVWAVRAGTVPTRVGLHGGQLEVRTQAGRFVFELTNVHTTLEMVGTPGRRGWKVLVHRRGLAPFVITAAMVDPHELTEALRYYRPDL